MVRSNLGQTWSTLVKLGQTWLKLSELWEMYPRPRFEVFLGIVDPSRVRNGLVKPRSNLVDFGQTWSTLVKLGQILGNVSQTPFWGYLVWWAFVGSGRLDSGSLFCVPTPEKIPGVKIELWQLPLLCLAFLGTWNVGQRINDLIFARSDFLGSRVHLRLSRSSSRFTCQPFRGPNGHSRSWGGSDRAWKGGSWLEVAFWCGSGHSRGMMPRGVWCTRVRSHLKTRRATFQPHFVLFLSFFTLWTPLRPILLFCSYLAIWDKDWRSIFAYALYE